MRLEAHCHTCDRTFLLSQIGPDSDAPGRCPFCGARFARHYTSVLVETVHDVELAAADFVRVLGRLQGMETGFDIDIEAALRSVGDQVRSHAIPKAG
jgi:hypothetical protein